MKFKLRITISDVIEVDTDNYESDTPENCCKEQQLIFDRDENDPYELVGWGGAFSCQVELVKVCPECRIDLGENGWCPNGGLYGDHQGAAP